MKFLLFFLFATSILLSSCNVGKLYYFKDAGKYRVPDTFAVKTNPDVLHIQPFDILKINVRVYNQQISSSLSLEESSSSSTDKSNPYLYGFLVDQNGEVNLPLIGKVNLLNLTIEQATSLLKKRYSEYIKNPFVEIKFLTFRVYVIGEVKQPGYKTLNNESGTLMDAITLSGDLTDMANKKEVKIIRNYGSHPVVYYVDMTSMDAFKNEGFKLKPNDIVYVEPLKVKGFLKYSSYMNVGLNLITAIISIILIFNRGK